MTLLPLPTRIALLRQHGSFCQAYSAAFQSGLDHFGDERGFIAYKKVWGTAMVLADPIAPAQSVENLIDRFLHENPDAAFWKISRALASVLASRGFLVNELGFETRLELASYEFSGQQRRNLRKAASRLAKLGYRIRECALSSLDLDQVKRVSQSWRHTRPLRHRQVSFLNRPIRFEEEQDVRWFFAFDRDDKIVGFCVCDPIYEAGDIVGYSADTRQHPDVNLMAGHALKHHVIGVFQSEGKKWLSLGLSPVDGIEDKDFTRDWVVRRMLRFAFTNALFNRFIYPLQGLAAHKRQFGGHTEQTYMAFNTTPSLPRLLKLLRACEII